MQFYRQLRQKLEERGTGRIVVVSSEPVDVLKRYLRDHNFEAHYAISSNLHPQNTPTLLRVNSKGVITSIWYGEQKDSGQQEILIATTP